MEPPGREAVGTMTDVAGAIAKATGLRAAATVLADMPMATINTKSMATDMAMEIATR
jgi:hypothetical protein